jgi:calcineurin-like phosphoesterase family protein
MKLSNYFWEPIKIEHTNVWFWSDMHLGHKCEHWETPLWKNRGFNSVEEHDEILIKRWNDNLGEESEIFHLGDIMFGTKGEERLTDVLNRLTFKTLYLFSGNHSAGYKQLLSKSSEENGTRYLDFNNKRVYFVPNYLEIMICGQPIVLSHYPLVSWNGAGKGSIMIFGHVHNNLSKSELGKMYLEKGGKVLEVTVESTPIPISFSEIRNKFKNKGSITFDHHTKDTLNPF